MKPSEKLILIKTKREVMLGICTNFYFSPVYDIAPLRICMANCDITYKEWPGFSGDLYFPVSSKTKGLSAEDEFSETCDMWDVTTKYGQQRHALLEWLIKEFQTKGH